ncbi:aminoglycoside phosphotransferase family protein [Streptomonospora arabica]|uniref:Aminoglycoside phosphotransferase family protein n=1 Tax=Streptomonospora arabica TaxID=412417 RepID=A0ABV9STP6_9ACTN
MTPAKLHAGEPDIDDDLVHRMVARRFPRWAGLPVARVESSGTENAMFRLGTDMAVRLPRREGAADAVGLEQRWLPYLAEHLPTAVPVPLGMGAPTAGFPWNWSVLRWLDGENPTVDGLARAGAEADRGTAAPTGTGAADPVRLAEDLAAFITALRSVPTAGAPESGRGGPLAERDRETRAAIDALHGTVDTRAATAVWEAALRLPDPAGASAWLHGDLSPGNVLVREGRLAAVIDFGGVGVGDPAADLIPAWNLLPAGAREPFRRAVGADRTAWQRARAWALSIALIQLPYYRATNPPLAANSRHVIGEVLAEYAAGA